MAEKPGNVLSASSAYSVRCKSHRQHSHQEAVHISGGHITNRGSAFIANDVSLLSAHRNYKTTAAIHAACIFVWNYRVASFIVGHSSIIPSLGSDTLPIVKPDDLSNRINKLPKWARDYIHNIHTFVGAPEVEELTYLRDQNKALIKLVAELKAETRRLKKRRLSKKR